MDPGDLQLRPLDTDAAAVPAPTERATDVRIVTIVLIVAAAVAAYIVFFQGRPGPITSPTARAPARAAAPKAPTELGGKPEPIDVPPLDQSDAFVRSVVEGISRHPTVLAWLTTHNLIRTFTVSVLSIADGPSPAPHLPALRPKEHFTVTQRNGDEHVDPRSYERYRAVADGVASIDVQGAARLYATLKPRLNEAYSDLGYPGQSFDDVMQRAIVVLLDTPTIETPIRLRRKGVVYRYDDARLEELTGAQKQLLRMGPRNGLIVKQTLRSLGVALGINPQALPMR